MANYDGHSDNTRLSREVRITIEDFNPCVYVTVEDGGTGIEDLSNAFTLAGLGAPDTLLNEHGFGLKHALASANPGNNNWIVTTRTEADHKAGRCREVSAPYRLSVDGFNGRYRTDWDGVLGPTGTIVQFGCSWSMFQTLREGRLQGDDFKVLLECLQEELGFTYGPLLRCNRLRMRLLARDQDGNLVVDCTVKALEPEWNPENEPVALPAADYDLGGGALKILCTYGTIIPTETNNRYYRGNMASSGVEIRVNGRVIESGQFKKIWKNEVHPTQNLFLARIDLLTEHPAAVPATRTAKNGFRDGDKRLEELYAWIRTMVPKPPRMSTTAVEKMLIDLLSEQKKRTLSQPYRVSLEEYAYQTLNEKVRMDLFTNENGSATVYEGKKDRTQPKDVYQLRMYWDGCVVDGIPVENGVLVAAYHSEGVRKLVEITNRMCGPDGRPYRFRLETWKDTGIDYPPVA